MNYIKLVFLIYFLTKTTHGNSLEEVSVAIELFGMDLEDKCSDLATVQRQIIFNTTSAHLKMVETEKNINNFIRDETKRLRLIHDINNLELSEKLLRQWMIFMKMGNVELPEQDSNMLISFKNSNNELSDNLKISYLNQTDNCWLSKNDVIKILQKSTNVKELESVWSASQKMYSKNKKQFPKVLKLVQKAAEVNDQQSVEEYWETLVEYSDAYETAKNLWDEIEPLYIKFHSFVKKRLEVYYHNEINSSIPVYLLGSNFGTDWSNIARLILPHRYLYDEITSMLEFDNIGGRKVYEIAENFTVEMGFKPENGEFWKNSIFNRTCPSHLLTYCSDKYTSVITCNSTEWIEYLDAHENMVRISLNNMNYPETALNEYRISALDEALVSLSTILALKNLPQAGIVPESIFVDEDDDNQNQMAALLLTALRILPRLPYYLLADMWRLQLLEDNSSEFVENWWALRQSMQRVKGVTNEELDFLGDPYINSNKPYIGKFMGNILQFQILEYFQAEVTDGVNILTHMSNDENFRTMLKQRGEKSWPLVLSENLYYDIASDALLEYFKPLEEYMDNAPVEQVTQTVIPKTTSTSTTTTTTTSKPDTNYALIPKDEPQKNRSQDIRALPKALPEQKTDKKVTSLPPIFNVKPTSTPTSGSVTATWAGALIGIGALTVVGIIVGRKKCKRKPVPHNRRHDV